MGNAGIIYYSADTGRGATVIDFGRKATDFFWEPIRERSSGWTLAGDMFSVVQTGRHRVTMTLGPFNNTGNQLYLERKLESLSSHLERGLPISLAGDLEKCWGGFISGGTGLDPGRTVIDTGGNLFSAYGAASIGDGDEIVIEGPNPTLHREIMRVQSYSGGVFQTYNETLYRYLDGPVMVRHRLFYPVLYLPADQLGKNIVTNDHRWTFTLDLTLEQGVEAFASMYSGDGVQVELAGPYSSGSESSQDAAGETLQSLIESGRVSSGRLDYRDYSFDVEASIGDELGTGV